MVRFTDLHRVYLQALLSRRFIPENVALELYKRAVSAIRGTSHQLWLLVDSSHRFLYRDPTGLRTPILREP